MKRAALAAFGATALLVVLGAVAPPALAHTELLTSDPADGSSLAEAPRTVELTFSEDLMPGAVSVSVVPDGGSPAALDAVGVDGPSVTVPWPASVTAGDVAVNYRVVSQDGHPVSGSVHYTIVSSSAPSAPASGSAAPAASSTAPQPTSDGDGESTTSPSIPPLAMISLGLAVGIAIGFAFYLRRRDAGGGA